MQTKNLFRHAMTKRIAALAAVSVFFHAMPGLAIAASSWNPTVLVNTESFQVIDEGDGATDVEIRFGSSLNERIYFNRASTRFQFTDDVHVEGNITGSGTLTVDGNAATKADLTINSDNGNVDATLSFGNDGGIETLRFNNGTNNFSFSDDVDVLGNVEATGDLAGSGSLRIEGGAGIDDTTFQVDATNNRVGIGTKAPETALEVIGTISGSILRARTAITSSGSLRINGVFTGATAIYGAGLADCDDGTGSKLLWDAATGRFTCGTDQTGGGGASTGALMNTFDNRYVNTSGDTMTGALRISNSAGLNASGSILTNANLTINSDNGAVDATLTFGSNGTAETLSFLNSEDRFQFSDDVHVTGNLTASGTLTVDGAVRFKSTLTINNLTYTFPAQHGSSGAVLRNNGNGTLSWSTSAGAGSGQIVALQPEYPNALYFASGASLNQGNVGTLAYTFDSTNKKNHYRWQSTKTTNQVYWTSVQVRVPDGFLRWDPVKPIRFNYRSSGGYLAVRMLDTAGSNVTLTGGENLRNASWTAANITGPESAGTYTVGGYVTLLLKTTASGSTAPTNDRFADMGQLELHWETRNGVTP